MNSSGISRNIKFREENERPSRKRQNNYNNLEIKHPIVSFTSKTAICDDCGSLEDQDYLLLVSEIPSISRHTVYVPG